MSIKRKGFPPTDYQIPINQNEAFLLNDKDIKGSFRKRYKNTTALSYRGQPDFEELLECIKKNIDKL